MKKQKITKGVIEKKEKAGSRKSNNGNKTDKGSGNRNLSGKINPILESGNVEAWEYVSEKTLKDCDYLETVCKKIESLEGIKRKLVYGILKDVKRKRRIKK